MIIFYHVNRSRMSKKDIEKNMFKFPDQRLTV